MFGCKKLDGRRKFLESTCAWLPGPRQTFPITVYSRNPVQTFGSPLTQLQLLSLNHLA
jgi:hypothetical protein